MRAILPTLLTLAYPILIYLNLGQFEPKLLALLLLAIALLRVIAGQQRIWLVAAIGATLLACLSWFGNALLPLKLYPVLVNALFLLVFSFSLIKPPSIIERLARLTMPKLPIEGVRYTRKVTILWSFFFLINGSIALYTCLYTSDAIWAYYNGGIAYVLMALLFAGEWLYRQRAQSSFNHHD